MTDNNYIFMKVQEKIRQDVEREGWSAIGVFGSEEGPSFTYTIGLSNIPVAGRPMPELLMVGVPSAADHSFFHMAIEMMKENEGSFDDMHRTDRLAVGLDTVFADLDGGLACEKYLIQAPPFLGFTPLVQQLVWPDKMGTFPFERGCDLRMAQMQCGVRNFLEEVEEA